MNKKVVKSSVLTFAVMMVMMVAMSITAFAASAPTGLVQVSDTGSSVGIQWNAVVETGVYGYNVYYSADGTNWERATTSSYADTTRTDGYIYGLLDGCSYYVKIATVVKTGTNYSNYQYVESAVSVPTPKS